MSHSNRYSTVKPENALQRAEDLLEVNSPFEALGVLSRTLCSRKARGLNVSSLEPLIVKYIEIAAKLGRISLLQNALQYHKNMSQATNVTSLERVIRHLFDCNKQSLQAFEGQSLDLSLVGDLSKIESFDGLFQSLLCDLEENKIDIEPKHVPEQIEEDLVVLTKNDFTSRLKFAWGSHLVVLSILRNNSRLESLYHSVLIEAFDFCARHKRKGEIQRLGQTLRSHTRSLRRPHDSMFAVNLAEPDVLKRFIDTCIAHIDCVTALEMSVEAFKTAEDIYDILVYAGERMCAAHHIPLSEMTDLLPTSSVIPHKKTLIKLLALYYKTLTRVFAVSEDCSFLAAAWNRYYTWTVVSSSDSKDLTAMADNVILSALASSFFVAKESNEDNSRFSREDRLAKMLRWNREPDRSTLLADAQAKRVLSRVSEPVLQVFNAVEMSFHPLTAAKNISSVLQKLTISNPEYSGYADVIRQVTVDKVLRDISSFYSAITFKSLLDLTNLSACENPSLFELEKTIIRGNNRGIFNIRMNHQQRQFEFPSLLNESDYLQLLLIPFYNENLQKEKSIAFEQCRQQQVYEYQENMQTRDLYKDMLRKNTSLSDSNTLNGNNEAVSSQIQAETEAIRARLEADVLVMKKEKQEADKAMQVANEARKFADSLKDKHGFIIKTESFDNWSTEDVDSLFRNHTLWERGNQKAKMKSLATRMDYIERALRQIEIPLIEKNAQARLEADMKQAIEDRRRAVEESKQQHLKELEIMARVQRMQQHADQYYQSFETLYSEEVEIKKTEAEKKLNEAKKQRRNEVVKRLSERIREQEEERKAKEQVERKENIEHRNFVQDAEKERKELEKVQQTKEKYMNPQIVSRQPVAEPFKDISRRGPIAAKSQSFSKVTDEEMENSWIKIQQDVYRPPRKNEEKNFDGPWRKDSVIRPETKKSFVSKTLPDNVTWRKI